MARNLQITFWIILLFVSEEFISEFITHLLVSAIIAMPKFKHADVIYNFVYPNTRSAFCIWNLFNSFFKSDLNLFESIFSQRQHSILNEI